jgi:hypothetical protein
MFSRAVRGASIVAIIDTCSLFVRFRTVLATDLGQYGGKKQQLKKKTRKTGGVLRVFHYGSRR